jgi:hypothetical protein
VTIAPRTGASLVLASSLLLAAAPATAASAHVRRQIDVYPGRHALAKALAEAHRGVEIMNSDGILVDHRTFQGDIGC